MDNTPGLLFASQMPVPFEQKRFRAAGLAMFITACGLLAGRLFVTLLNMGGLENEIALDVIFSVSVQAGILFTALFFLYKHTLGLKTREVFKESNFQKTQWFNYALAVPIGILGLFVTIGISAFWQIIIRMFGYNRPGAGSGLPDAFNIGLFLLSLFLTAVLPAICEEFAMRGIFFSAMKNSYKGTILYVIMAVAFGLFHQNITQVFYTALFGAAMAFIVLKTKSIYPCIIVHFVNNGFSVYLDYAEKYNWPGGKIMDTIFSGLTQNALSFLLTIVIYILLVAAFLGLLFALHFLNSNKVLKNKKEVIQDSGFDHTHNRVILSGYENQERVRELGLDMEVYGRKLEPKLYRPSLRDKAFYIGAIVTCAAFTVFSFAWGLFY